MPEAVIDTSSVAPLEPVPYVQRGYYKDTDYCGIDRLKPTEI